MNGLAVGAGMLVALVLVLAVAPAVIDADPNAQSLRAALAAPGPDHWLGTDQYGRSILARLIEGGRHSLALAAGIVGLCMATGMILAGIAATLGGTWDTSLTALADGIYAVPGLLLVLVVAGLFGGGVTVLVAALWGASWPEYYRVSRGVLRQVAASDHVLASRLAGAPMPAVLWYQMLPEAVPYVAGIGSLALGRVILAIASLGFLGIGIAPPQAEWGAMVSELLPHFERATVQILAIVAAMAWTVTAALLVGQGLTSRFASGAAADD